MIYIRDSLVVVNNKFENRIFIYDRLGRVEYDINEDTFNILEEIKNNNYTKKSFEKEYGKDFLKQLFDLNIITTEKQRNINNVKRLTTFNNVRLFVELTNKCNLNCKHCYGGFSCNNSDYLDINDLKHMIDDASKNGVYQFDITGGEPTLYPYLEELVEYVYYSGMMMRVFTNLTTFSPKFMRLCLDYGIKDIVTSVDSCIREDHDEFRGMIGSFDKTLSAIGKLKEKNINVTMNTMIGSHNRNHIDDMVEFINDLEIKSVLDVIVPEGRGRSLNEDIKSSARLIKSIYDKNSDRVDKNAFSINCGVANRFVYVKSDGNIYLCPSLIESKYLVGTLKDYSTSEIWTKITNDFSNIGCNKKTDKCNNCTGGCRARALKMHDDICAEDDVYCIINGVEK